MKVTREQLIERAMLESIQTLEQVGCVYTITDPTGKVHSNEVKRSRRNDFSALNITQRLIDSSIGQGVFFACPDGVDPLLLQSALCGHAHKIFGRESYATSIDRERGGVLVICGKKRGVDLAAVAAEFAINRASRQPTAAEPQLL